MYRITALTSLEHAADLVHVLLERDQDRDPLATRLLLVQGPAIGRWLATELAARSPHGIIAGLDLQAVTSFCRGIVPTAGKDPYNLEALLWRVDEVVCDPSTLPSSWSALAQAATPLDRAGRHALALRLATLYDSLQLGRPDWLRSWQAGQDVAGVAPWLGDLWRHLQVPDVLPLATRFERLVAALEREGPAARPAGVPREILVVAPTALTPIMVQVLRALGEHGGIDVHVLHQAPTTLRTFWADQPNEGADYDPGTTPFDLAGVPGNGLLAACGRQAHDLARLLAGSDPDGNHTVDLDAVLEQHDVRRPPAPGLLGQLQGMIHEACEQPCTLAGGDRSLRVHRCHSPLREAEVLRDALAGLLSSPGAPRPDEVLVAVPDLDTYGPLLEAVLGALPGEALPLPVHVIGRPPAADPTVAAVLAAIDLAQSDATAEAVLAPLEAPAVRRRFGLDEDDLAVIRHRLAHAGVSWGLDSAHRETASGYSSHEGTWRTGLDRLLLGLATGAEDALLAGLLPCAARLGGDDLAVGGLAVYLDVLAGFARRARDVSDGRTWRDRLFALREDLVAPVGGDEAAALQDLGFAFAALPAEARALDLRTVRLHLDRLLSDSERAHGWTRGGITVTTIKGLRGVPFRVVAILGLDSSFPRLEPRDPFDPTTEHRRLGDRSLTLDDRQAFLDLLLAARSHLHLSWTGIAASDGSLREPSTCLEALSDLLDRRLQREDGRRLDHRAVLVRHRLHGASPAYFCTEPSLQDPGHEHHAALSSHDPDACKAAAARLARDASPVLPGVAPFVDAGLAARDAAGWPPPVLGPADLRAWWADPLQRFATAVLALRFADEAVLDEREPVALDALAQWELVRDLVYRREVAQDTSVEGLVARWRQQGRLPHGHAGALYVATARTSVEQLDQVQARALAALGAEPALLRERFDVDLPLPGDGGPCRVLGSVVGCGAAGGVVLASGRLNGKKLLEAWVQHQLVNAQRRRRQEAAEPTLVVGVPKTDPKKDDPTGGGLVRFAPAAATPAAWTALGVGTRQAMRSPRAYLPELALKTWDRRAGAPGDTTAHLEAWQGEGDQRFLHSELARPRPWTRLLWRGVDDPLQEAWGWPWFIAEVWTPLMDSLEAV